jgi:multiple sugar transport system permease protein/sn-glycerol 3-phosphate transport system permease protein
MQSKRRREQLRLGLAYALILVGTVVVLMPLAWMISTSLKTMGDTYLFPPRWIPDPPQWDNYVAAMTQFPFPLYALNSTIVCGSVIAGTLLSCSLAAYGFARLRMPGRNLIFYIILTTIMLPSTVTLLPLYSFFINLGWLNTFKPLIVPAFFGNAFYIFLLRQFFLTIPPELEDAARIDGASYFGIYRRIMVPLARPALIAVAIFSFNDSWNDFFTPLIYLSDPTKYTVAVGLSFFQGDARNATEINWLMAASFVALVPCLIIFFFAQRLFIKGIVFTGIKG